VKIVIEKDGSITNPQIIIQSISSELDKETLRVISVSPKFAPGSVNGKPVRCYYDFPLNCTLVTAD
jgi:outer membrane biosynthesis protein TonB